MKINKHINDLQRRIYDLEAEVEQEKERTAYYKRQCVEWADAAAAKVINYRNVESDIEDLPIG